MVLIKNNVGKKNGCDCDCPLRSFDAEQQNQKGSVRGGISTFVSLLGESMRVYLRVGVCI